MNTLCIDIGNSNVKVGVFKGKRLVYSFEKTIEAFLKAHAPFASCKKYAVEKAIICSVVKHVNKKVMTAVKKSLGLVPLIINETCVVSLKTRYAHKKLLGDDRVVNIYGALCSFNPPFIMVSCGTAITVDLVDKNGVHQGGYIVPGLAMNARALSTFTAALPYVNLNAVTHEYGRDTNNSIRSGIIYGTAACIDGLIARLKKKSKGPLLVIATGGDIECIKKYCSSVDRIVKKHTLKALNSILHSL